MKNRFLAGMNHAEFLRRHWQKRPLIARDALREYRGAIGRDDLIELAGREDVESRIVTRVRDRWEVRHGPFGRRDIARLPDSGWTLLVQGVDEQLTQAARLLREFSFIPHARVDDVMVSYAAPGGGVGPHYDSYDVFLVQGHGRRRWQASAQRTLDLVPDAPLKLLRRFVPRHEWVVEPGDLLYLPPGWAHDGVALEECITYSVGFRAPSASELGARFLEFMHDRLALRGDYADPDLKPTRKPGRIPAAMVKRSAEMLEDLRWSRAVIVEFLGRYLTEPKPNVVFARPRSAHARERFEALAKRHGVRLSASTRMLFYGREFFINGEAFRPGAAATPAFVALANDKRLGPSPKLDAGARRLLYDWYLAGYIAIDMNEDG